MTAAVLRSMATEILCSKWFMLVSPDSLLTCLLYSETSEQRTLWDQYKCGLSLYSPYEVPYPNKWKIIEAEEKVIKYLDHIENRMRVILCAT